VTGLRAAGVARRYGVATAFLALVIFGANKAAGNLWLLLICGCGQVVGTLVSEGIVTYRIDHGRLPESWSHIIDVGPSYVVVAAIAVAAMLGSWLAKIAAMAAFASLVFIGGIFSGLGSFQVAPVGHLTAMIVASVMCVALGLARRRRADGRHDEPARDEPVRDAQPSE
jgi:hypothetical protein